MEQNVNFQSWTRVDLQLPKTNYGVLTGSLSVVVTLSALTDLVPKVGAEKLTCSYNSPYCILSTCKTTLSQNSIGEFSSKSILWIFESAKNVANFDHP